MAYQPPIQGYAAPGSAYGAPQYGAAQYGVPQPVVAYGAPPQQQYGQPPAPTGYGAYGAPQPVQPQPTPGFGGYGGPPPPQQQRPSYGAFGGGGIGAAPPQAYQGPVRSAAAPAPVVQQPAKFKPGDEIMGHPTCKPVSNFDEEADASAVRTAIKEGSRGLINIIAYRSTEQRQKIRQFYKTMTGRDMMEDLRDMLHMNTHRVVAAMMRSEDERDAHYLFKAMKGRGYDEDALIEVIVSRSSEQLKAIKAAYKRTYDVDLEDEVLREARGSFKKLLIGLLQANRTPWETEVDMAKCRKDAKDLYNAGEGKWGTETSVFRRILCVRSIPQLRCIFQEYDKICKYTIEQSCKREMSGNLLKGVRTIIRFAEDHHLYFATVLYKSMKGLGTDDRQLVRTVVSRCEYDMLEIKEAFQRKFGKPLSKMIRGDCSGDYRECLLRLIGE